MIPRLYDMLPESFADIIDNFKATVASLPQKEADMVNIDFSAMPDFGYYNGIVFKGYVMGVPAAVVSGGQYDRLMKKMGRNGSAIGFAVYPELLQQLNSPLGDDTDILLLYGEGDEVSAVLSAAEALRSEGKRVAVASAADGKKKYGKIYKLVNGEVKAVENNA